MIGLDTNVFLRLFVEDDPNQAARARRFRNDVCFVNAVVLSEFVWRLARRMNRTKPEIVRLLDDVLAADDLEIAHRDRARRALHAFRSGRADFADYYLAEINREGGCATTATFDRDTLDSRSFSPVP